MPLMPEDEALCERLEQHSDSEIGKPAAALIRRMAGEVDDLWDRLSQVYMALRGEIGEDSPIWEEVRRIKEQELKRTVTTK
jgi:hypothetical protein